MKASKKYLKSIWFPGIQLKNEAFKIPPPAISKHLKNFVVFFKYLLFIFVRYQFSEICNALWSFLQNE